MWVRLLGARMVSVMAVIHSATGKNERGNSDGDQCFHLVKRVKNLGRGAIN